MDWHITHFDTLDSTNLEAKRMIRTHTAAASLHGTVITAEQQTCGKGRLGRTWESPASSGLWFTAIIQPQIPMTQASLYSFATAVSVAEAIEQTTGLVAKLKWPNDILLHGKKLCGILLELVPCSPTQYYILIGIGLNVNQQQQEFADELAQKATSLAIEGGHTFARAPLLDAILHCLDANCALLAQDGFASIRTKWKAKSCIIGQEVSVQQHNREQYCGIAEDIAADGSLLVRTATGLQTVMAGDVSLRAKDGTYAFEK